MMEKKVLKKRMTPAEYQRLPGGEVRLPQSTKGCREGRCAVHSTLLSERPPTAARLKRGMKKKKLL